MDRPPPSLPVQLRPYREDIEVLFAISYRLIASSCPSLTPPGSPPLLQQNYVQARIQHFYEAYVSHLNHYKPTLPLEQSQVEEYFNHTWSCLPPPDTVVETETAPPLRLTLNHDCK
jgi:hypothetical protein